MSIEGTPSFEFAPDDKLDSFAYQLIEKAFGLKADDFIITNLSELEDFLPNAGRPTEEDFPGHTYIPYYEVPLDDRHVYDKYSISEEDKKVFMVWYPNFTEEEDEQIGDKNRAEVIRRVEYAFGISLAEYEGETVVYAVADFITKQRLETLKKLHETS